MGDRANIVVKDQYTGGEVYLYSHWGGSDMPVTLCRGLTRGRPRWDDPSYLARIIFNTMTKGHEDDETGFGIATSPPDNEYPFLVVDCKEQAVVVRSYDWRNPTVSEVVRSVPFADYVSGSWVWDENHKNLVLAGSPEDDRQ